MINKTQISVDHIIEIIKTIDKENEITGFEMWVYNGDDHWSVKIGETSDISSEYSKVLQELIELRNKHKSNNA